MTGEKVLEELFIAGKVALDGLKNQVVRGTLVIGRNKLQTAKNKISKKKEVLKKWIKHLCLTLKMHMKLLDELEILSTWLIFEQLMWEDVGATVKELEQLLLGKAPVNVRVVVEAKDKVSDKVLIVIKAVARWRLFRYRTQE